ncbi:MAG: TolC family protein [Candidatus Gastranaerophilales bacterium]|nr:TolC family protein [Candidatus Gastranaerophilales bacterium]
MNKKILMIFLSAILVFNLTPAFAFFKSNNTAQNKIEPAKKLEYVNAGFFEEFQDEYLSGYIIKAVNANHNARQASYKTMEYRENIKVALGAQLPALSVGVDYLGLKIPDEGPASLFKKNNLIMPFNASWELDLLLKNNDKRLSTKKVYEASVEEEKAIYIALAADVASAYFNILNLDKQIQINQCIIKNQKEIYERNKRMLKQGVISQTELNKQKQSLDNLTVSTDELLKQRAMLLNQLRLLIGENPDYEVKRSCIDKISLKNNPPSSISSDVIYARPDVLAAEKQLESAGINVKVARKELLPTFKITGVMAFSSMYGNFFSWDGAIAALLAGATQELFAGGRRLANLRIKKLQYEQLFENYKQVDLNAAKEVNDALLISKYDYNIYEKTFNNNCLEAGNFEMTKNKYSRGTINTIELLNRQNDLFALNKELASKKTDNLVDLITLYKAVGGQL